MTTSSFEAPFVLRWWIGCRVLFTTFIVVMQTLMNNPRNPQIREICDRQLKNWSRRVVRLIRAEVDITDCDKFTFEKGKRYIFMSNHASHFDIPFVYYALNGTIRMIAKKELGDIPLFGRAGRKSEFIFIDRNNRNQAKKDLAAARKLMESGVAIWMAPEGTRSRTGELLPFKKGGFHLAMQTDAIIVPFAIVGAQRLLPADSTRLRLNESIEVKMGVPIDSTDYTASERNQLAQDVYQQIDALLSNKPIKAGSSKSISPESD
ncbi:MAG: 1-acyl-sn-glycerol-3-phosphate acyltransferase [Kangiellaceae bacterium]|jgi:1-acyl-sn-glycerol-3-phosphate acyltransferase|nr:1-acyl-sn-glycerol-3-phosphate acyltransferase [Kangiellaceae bacterium]|tara:strand:- start:3068 stop:3856 length:789 start_codon:yes stop_codon:yes gene_type:complete